MMPSIRLLADQHIFVLNELVPRTVDLQIFNPDDGLPADVITFDALLVRTVTNIDRSTLPQTGRLKWVGTASAGYDHIDVDWLKANGVKMGFAAGCNARAVAEYVLTMAMHVANVRGWNFAGTKLGIVGVGFVGATLANMASRMGIEVVVYDPPRAHSDPGFISATLEQLLACDVLSLHTPLTESGPYATRGWLDTDKLFAHNRLLLIQASRGGVADEAAVIAAFDQGYLRDVVIDVWQDEPRVNQPLLDRSIVGTPHIAGYSRQAKRSATEIALHDLNRCLDGGDARYPEQVVRPKIRPLVMPAMTVDTILDSGQELLPHTLIGQFLDYDHYLRSSMSMATTADSVKEFRRLRTMLPYRDEYRDTSITTYPNVQWPLLDLFREI